MWFAVTLSNLFPLEYKLKVWENRRKSHGITIGEYRGLEITVVWFLARSSCVDKHSEQEHFCSGKINHHVTFFRPFL
jgi:hypothetical protein